MKLFVHTQELYTLQVTGQESLAQIKAHVALSETGHMLGGKVHGSLACAGKVRGQTSKVAKQEKKSTGRAKRHYTVQSGLCQGCTHLWQEGPQCQFL
ncbi:unnamed protein product, partial [Rangifer tarandus platyrhynchus]